MQARFPRMRIPILLLSLSAALMAQQSERKFVAIVNGENIPLDVIERAAATDLLALEHRKAQFEIELTRDRHAVLDKALQSLLTEKVLSLEAENRHLSLDQLLALEVDGATPSVTDGEILQLYEANEQDLTGTLEDNAGTIRSYLRETRRQPVLDAFVAELMEAYGAASYLDPPRLHIAVDGHPFKGPAEAPVTVVEFSDFECPYCRAIMPTLRQLLTDYRDKVRIVYFQFPLADIHKNALKAAEASLCAHEQGKFWQLHDAMFHDQTGLSVDGLKQKASAIHLQRDVFDTCLDSGKYFESVREDVLKGAGVGVTGTPALLINGRLLVGNQPYAEIRRIVEDELGRIPAK